MSKAYDEEYYKIVDIVMERAQEYEQKDLEHTNGYGSANDLRILRREILRLRENLDYYTAYCGT